MVDLYTWAMRHRPFDVPSRDVYTILDMNYTKYLHRVLLRKAKIDVEDLRKLTPNDIMQMPVYQHYVVLMSYILINNICDIPAEVISVYIDWMLRDPETWHPAVTAYIWANSSLNSMGTHSIHSSILSVVDYGCRYHTLNYLWNVANSKDSVLTEVTVNIAKYIGAPVYLPMITFTYLCSGVEPETLSLFFADVSHIDIESILEYTDAFCSFYWYKDVIESLIHMKYTVGKIWKYIKYYGMHGIMERGRRFPVSILSPRIFKPEAYKHCSRIKSIVNIPDGYVVPQHLFCPKISECDDMETELGQWSKYECWYNSLSDARKAHLKSINPVVYTACESGQYEYVYTILDSIISSV